MSDRNPQLAEAARRLLSVGGKADSDAVLWYELILEMEAFRYETGFGVANTWGFVHDGNYAEARRNFDAVVADYNERYADFGKHFDDGKLPPVPPIDLTQ